MKQPGYLVKTKEGKIGRTFKYKGFVNGKIPVYLIKGNLEDSFHGFEQQAILCDKETLKVIGCVD